MGVDMRVSHLWVQGDLEEEGGYTNAKSQGKAGSGQQTDVPKAIRMGSPGGTQVQEANRGHRKKEIHSEVVGSRVSRDL